MVSGGIIPLIGAGLLGVKKQIEHFKKYTLKITKRETWEVVENFETKEEADKAEKEYNEKNALILKKKEERQKRVDEVNSAFVKYVEDYKKYCE